MPITIRARSLISFPTIPTNLPMRNLFVLSNPDNAITATNVNHRFLLQDDVKLEKNIRNTAQAKVSWG